MRRLYTLLMYVALPFVAVAISVRAWRERAAAGSERGASGAGSRAAAWAERFGFRQPSPGGGIWVHAASVGEVQVAAILIGALQASMPALAITLTCTTPGGRARARDLLPQISAHYAPLDLPGSVRRTLARLRPRLLILIETELWPNLLHEAQRAGVPTLIASARVSASSARWYARLPGLLRAALHSNVWIAAQTLQDAERFGALGVPAERVSVIGNIKFDRSLPAQLRARGAVLRARYARGRAVWVAGSTHPAETPIVLAAHRQLLRVLPQALLVLAPRHLHRLDEAVSALNASGLSYTRRSSDLSMNIGAAIEDAAPVNALPQSFQVLLLDTLGELIDFYAAADVAFVGGSLVRVGGHNLLEPAALGLPVLAGAHQFNSPEVAQILAQYGGLTTVADADTLGACVARLLSDPQARAQQGERARAAMDSHRGALERLVALIEPLS